MSMRIFSLGVVLFLVACGGSQEGAEPSGEKIECALDGDVNYAAVCTLERNANLLVLRRPDGGFRRVEMLAGSTYGVLDGAEEASITVGENGRTVISVGYDHFRLPADAVRP